MALRTLMMVLAVLAGYLLWGTPRCTGALPGDKCQIGGRHD
jgi:hypothetical protein